MRRRLAPATSPWRAVGAQVLHVVAVEASDAATSTRGGPSDEGPR